MFEHAAGRSSGARRGVRSATSSCARASGASGGRFDYERLGGAPLLGVKGTVLITHGRARRRMIGFAVEVGRRGGPGRASRSASRRRWPAQAPVASVARRPACGRTAASARAPTTADGDPIAGEPRRQRPPHRAVRRPRRARPGADATGAAEREGRRLCLERRLRGRLRPADARSGCSSDASRRTDASPRRPPMRALLVDAVTRYRDSIDARIERGRARLPGRPAGPDRPRAVAFGHG